MENKISYLRFLLEYGQEPLWWYDDESGVIDVGLIPEWEDDAELEKILYLLSDEFDALFINNKHEFSYVGFKNDEHRQSFFKLADAFATQIFAKNAGKYKIINDLKLEDWHSIVGNDK
jgi:hypothetical protein